MAVSIAQHFLNEKGNFVSMFNNNNDMPLCSNNFSILLMKCTEKECLKLNQSLEFLNKFHSKHSIEVFFSQITEQQKTHTHTHKLCKNISLCCLFQLELAFTGKCFV